QVRRELVSQAAARRAVGEGHRPGPGLFDVAHAQGDLHGYGVVDEHRVGIDATRVRIRDGDLVLDYRAGDRLGIVRAVDRVGDHFRRLFYRQGQDGLRVPDDEHGIGRVADLALRSLERREARRPGPVRSLFRDRVLDLVRAYCAGYLIFNGVKIVRDRYGLDYGTARVSDRKAAAGDIRVAEWIAHDRTNPNLLARVIEVLRWRRRILGGVDGQLFDVDDRVRRHGDRASLVFV